MNDSLHIWSLPSLQYLNATSIMHFFTMCLYVKRISQFLIVYMGINSCSRKVCFIFVNNRVLSSWKLFIKNNTNFKGCLYESIGFKPLIVLMYLKRAVNFNQYWTKDYLNSRPNCSLWHTQTKYIFWRSRIVASAGWLSSKRALFTKFLLEFKHENHTQIIKLNK